MTAGTDTHSEEVERELKLIVRGKIWSLDDEALIRMLLSALRACGLEAAVTLKSHGMVNTVYWDTKRFRLACAGLACRVRLEGGQRSVTIKTEDSGSEDRLLRKRMEFHAVFLADAGDVPDPGLFRESTIGSRIQALVGDRKLHPVFMTRVDRRTFRMAWQDGCSIELMLDHGKLCAGSSRRQIREMEFELLAGSPERLFKTAQALTSRFHLRWTAQSKFERGLHLAGGPAMDRTLPDLPVADPDTSLDDAVSAIMRAGLVRLADALKRIVSRSGTPETLHDFRVDLRHLQSIVDLLQPVLEPTAFKTLRGAIKCLFRPTSPLREADMLLDSWRIFVGESGQAAICRKNLIQKKLDRHRLACLGDLRRSLSRSRWTHSLLTLATWAHADRRINGEVSVRVYVAEQTDALVSAVVDAARLEALIRAEDYHALRIRVKRLRILSMLFVLPDSPGAPGQLLDADTLRGLQDALGDLHDAQVNHALADSILPRLSAISGFSDWLDLRCANLRTACDNLLDASVRTR